MEERERVGRHIEIAQTGKGGNVWERYGVGREGKADKEKRKHGFM